MVRIGVPLYEGTISVYHQILVNMQGADKGSKDTALQWESILPISPYGDWMFHSTPLNSAAYGTRSVYAITHTGGSTYAGESRQTYRHQRPALCIYRECRNASVYYKIIEESFIFFI